jgi:hypothetical protein
METIQVVLEAALLKAADRAARRLKLNRSAFIREAARSHSSSAAGAGAGGGCVTCEGTSGCHGASWTFPFLWSE